MLVSYIKSWLFPLWVIVIFQSAIGWSAPLWSHSGAIDAKCSIHHSIWVAPMIIQIADHVILWPIMPSAPWSQKTAMNHHCHHWCKWHRYIVKWSAHFEWWLRTEYDHQVTSSTRVSIQMVPMVMAIGANWCRQWMSLLAFGANDHCGCLCQISIGYMAMNLPLVPFT